MRRPLPRISDKADSFRPMIPGDRLEPMAALEHEERVDVPLERARRQQIPGDVVEPQALTRIAQLLGRFHVRTLDRNVVALSAFELTRAARPDGNRAGAFDHAAMVHSDYGIDQIDGAIVEFRSVVDAVESGDRQRCAIEVQHGMIERNAGVPPERRIEFRIGIHLGDVVEESDGDLMGDGVNIAARLQSVCKPGGVCLSGAAYDQVRDRVTETFVDLGEKPLKNIARPVRVYEFALDRRSAKSAPAALETPPLALPDKPSIAILPFRI